MWVTYSKVQYSPKLYSVFNLDTVHWQQLIKCQTCGVRAGHLGLFLLYRYCFCRAISSTGSMPKRHWTHI